MKPVRKNAEGLRDALFDEINLMRAGTGDWRRAQAIANLASLVIDAARVEIQSKGLSQFNEPARLMAVEHDEKVSNM